MTGEELAQALLAHPAKHLPVHFVDFPNEVGYAKARVDEVADAPSGEQVLVIEVSGWTRP